MQDVQRYVYLDPTDANISKDIPEVLFWKVRAKTGDPKRPKTFWYVRPDPDLANPYRRYPYAYGSGEKGLPDVPAERELVSAAMFRLTALRAGVARQAQVMLWCEGEKDSLNARIYGVPAFSHHGGAGKATPEQVAHLAGYKGTVGVVCDRDDAGYADGWHRMELLREIGVECVAIQAHPAVTNPGYCPPGQICHCYAPCPPPSQMARGVDLSDHIAAGHPLNALVECDEKTMEDAAERNASYGYTSYVPSGYTPEEWKQLNDECRAILAKNGGRVW